MIPLTVSNSVLLKGGIHCGTGSLQLHNLVVGGVYAGRACELRHCTIPGLVNIQITASPNILVDCIIGEVRSRRLPNKLDYCNVFRRYQDLARPGKNCMSVDPQFVNPKGHDYRLGPKSPCRGKASDGGDMGVQYTPEMLDMLKLAFQLRAAGVIKF